MVEENINLTEAYKKISVEPEENFSFKDDSEFIINLMNTIFEKKFLLVESKLLENDVILLNTSFVKLLKASKETDYKKVHLLFVVFCDYFDIEYNKVFNHLHDKLQTLIKIGAKEFIGLTIYNKYSKKKNGTLIVTSLFDLILKENG